MTSTDIRQFAVSNPKIGQGMCQLMLERERMQKPTVIKDINDLGVPVGLIWDWTVDPDTNVIDVRRLSLALYEHCWGEPASRRPDYCMASALNGSKSFIVEQLVLHENYPVPCPTCDARVGVPCTYYGGISQNKHDARMDAIHGSES